MRWNWQQEWFRICLTSRISFSMGVLVSLHPTVLSTALLLCWPWWCRPAQAPLAERAFQCAAQEGRESAQGSGWGSGREHSRTDPLGVLNSWVRSLSPWFCVSQPTHKCVLRDTRALREPVSPTVMCQALPHTSDGFFPSAEHCCPSVVWGGVGIVGASRPVDLWCSGTQVSLGFLHLLCFWHPLPQQAGVGWGEVT